MMISSYSQTVAFGLSVNIATRMEASGSSPRSTAPAQAGGTDAPPPGDRVTISPEAAAEAANRISDAPLASKVERRAEALFRALDADRDGSITQEEFTDGASDLLRRARGHRRGHHRGHDDGPGRSEGRHGNRGGRLDAKLERLFASVDVDDDGTVTRQELTEALGRVRGRGRGNDDGPSTSPAPPVTAPFVPTPTSGGTTTGVTPPITTTPSSGPADTVASPVPGTTAPAPVADDRTGQLARQLTITRVTFVAVAIERYTAVAGPVSEPQLAATA